MARAVSLHLSGRAEDALKELQRAQSRGEKSVDLLIAMGHIQFELEQFEEAAASYRELLKLAPEHTAATFNLAVCLERLGNWQKAAEVFKSSCQL
jgi:Flp pilus assembly protein TadD